MRKIAIFLILALPLAAGTITKDFTFSSNDLILNQSDQYTLIEMKGADNITTEGEPVMPAFIKHIAIPPSAEVRSVEVVEEGVEYLPGKFLAYPGQRPRPFSVKKEIPFVNPKPEIYNSSNLYPAQAYESSPTGSKHGWRVCVVTLHPLRYLPKEGKLRLTKDLKITINYDEGVYPIQTISQLQYDVFSRAVKALVSNPEDVDGYKPNVRPNSINDVNYAIITSASYVNNWDALKGWKTKKGYLADVFSTTWIYSNYTGKDNQEKIRRFIRDYYQNKGLIWAVLGGDYNIVPDRDIYSTYYSPYYIACDWYYCDLDSNWNRDNDGYWGEVGDVIPPECYFEVYCARAPIDNVTDINNMINKILIFDKNPPTTTIRTTVLPSVLLFSGYHGRIVNNYIASMFPSGWTHWKLEDQTSPATKNSINSHNPQFIHIAAHGDRNGTYTRYGSPVFTESDIPSLTNQLPFICNSIACYSGQFDYSSDDCFAEELVLKSSPSGAVCDIFNSRYGFGQPPSMGPSEQMDTCFYYSITRVDTLWFGVAHAISKEHYRNPIWGGGGVWHYCGTELNPFGDPELNMYLSVPVKLHEAFQDPIPPGTQNFTVTVTDSKAPVEDALVCCYQSGQLHETGRTNASGQATISITPVQGSMFVTASAFNYLPVEDTCTVEVGVAEGQTHLTRTGIWLGSTVTKDRITINYAFNNARTLKVSLFNSIGAKVSQIYQGKVVGKGTITHNVQNLPAGVYFVKIEHEKTEIKQVLLIH